MREARGYHEFGGLTSSATSSANVGRSGSGGVDRACSVLDALVEIPGGNCIKIGLPGKSILGDYFLENRTSQRPFLLLRISFPGRPIFLQSVPVGVFEGRVGGDDAGDGAAAQLAVALLIARDLAAEPVRESCCCSNNS